MNRMKERKEDLMMTSMTTKVNFVKALRLYNIIQLATS